jgi:dipeptidyl aminopeptidase/acylaminoacyl peptidase
MRPERIAYDGAEGVTIDALLYTPPAERRSGGGILLVHGGPNWLAREIYEPFLQYLVVVEGHAILAPNVRGSTGYGRTFMDRNTGDYGGLDQKDWVAGIGTLVSRGGVDQGQVAIWGRSYGGYATMLSLCQYPETFRCGVAQFGVSDWFSLWDRSIPWVRRLMAHQLGHPWRDKALYADRSPITHVDRIRSPILLLHGDADAGVPADQSLDFAERLAQKGHAHEIQIYPGEGHGFNEPHHVVDAAGRIAGFFQRYLHK